MHSLFARRNFVKPTSGRGMNYLVVSVTGLLFHRASPPNWDQICRVQEVLATASQRGIISCHCAPADNTPGDKTVSCATGAGLAMKAVCHLTYIDAYLTEPKSGKANRTFFTQHWRSYRRFRNILGPYLTSGYCVVSLDAATLCVCGSSVSGLRYTITDSALQSCHIK
jgi:hypothetical protein